MKFECQNVDVVERSSFLMNQVSVREIVHQSIQKDIFYINHTKLSCSTFILKKVNFFSYFV